MAHSIKKVLDDLLAGTIQRDVAERVLEHIENDAKMTWVLISIAFFVFAITCTGIQEMRIAKRDHIIVDQRIMLSVPAEDSIRFKCVHCGWEHNLKLEPQKPNK